MLQLRCTAKARKLAKIRDKDLSDPIADNTILGGWYLNVFQLGRRKAFIFMNERTLLSFIIFGVRSDNLKNFIESFQVGLIQVLELIGANPDQIRTVLTEYDSYCYTKTISKSVLGNMNDLVDLYQHFVWSGRGLENCDLDEIIIRINETPQRNLDWNYSSTLTLEFLENAAAI
jgi:hypothetical protein